MNYLPNQIVIENVVQCKMRGKVAYQSHLPASIALNITYVKPFDDPSGKGYQRPVDIKRCNDFALYLSKGEDALFTPVLLNAAGNWEFVAYDKHRPAYGRLICKAKASLMDGQHRLGGIKRYIEETNSEINVPFLALHYLDDDEEIRLFDTINTKAKGIGTSLSKYLRREHDEISWIATELITRNDSPFHYIGTLIGKRSKGRHVTLQNLYKALLLLTKEPHVAGLSKEEKISVVLLFYRTVQELFPNDWLDYKGSRLTHIVCLNAVSMAGSQVLSKYVSKDSKRVNYNKVAKGIQKLRGVDWSSEGSLRYLKGVSGSKMLAVDLAARMLPDS